MKLISSREDLRTLIIEGNLWYALIYLAIPIMVSNFLSSLYATVDLYFLGKVGINQVAAIGLLSNFLQAFIAIGGGLGVGAVSIIGREIGEGRFEGVRGLSAQIIIISQLLGILCAVLLIFLAYPIMKVSVAEGEILVLGAEYLQITAIGFPFVFLTFVFNAFNNAEGRTWTPLVFSLLGIIVNFLLNPLFIFTLGLGMNGSAMATVLAQALQAAVILLIFYLYKGDRKFRRGDFTFNRETFTRLFKGSLIASFSQCTNSLGFALYFMTINSFGTVYLVAVTSSNRIFGMFYMAVVGFSGALVALVAQNVGARKIQRAFQVFKYTNIAIVFLSLIMVNFLIFDAEFFLRFFVQDPDVINFSQTYLNWFAPAIVLIGTFDALLSLFLGFGFINKVMIFSFMRIFIFRVPSAIFLSKVFGLKESSIYLGVVYGTIIAWAIAYAYYYFVFKKKHYSIATNLSI